MAEPVEKALQRRVWWYGWYCEQTHTEILERMTELLGDKYFTVVICNSYSETDEKYLSVEVRTSSRLTDGPKAWSEPRTPGISWGITGYSMGVHSEAKTQSEGRSGHKLDNIYFTFEPYKMTIDLYAPAGYKLRWIFAVEDHEENL